VSKPNPVAPDTLAIGYAAALDELKSLDGIDIANDEDAEEANTYLRDRLKERDFFERLRKERVAPINAEHARVQAEFKPVLDLYDTIASTIKKALGKFMLAKQAEQKRLYQEAAKAAQDESPQALTAALVAADEAEPVKLEGSSVRGVWRVKRVLKDMLPLDYLIEDTKKIEAFARQHGADDRPVIPGVVFELEAVVSVRRA